jgi:hypothetical protein
MLTDRREVDSFLTNRFITNDKPIRRNFAPFDAAAEV